MNYLIAWHWGWLLTALIIGGIIGFATFARPRSRWVDTPVILAIVVFAVAVAAALLKFFPGRSGYWLDLAVLMVATYVVGCFLGWLLKLLLSGEPAAVRPVVAAAGAPFPAAGVAPSVKAKVADAASSGRAVTPTPAAAEPERAPALPDEAAHAGARPVGYVTAHTGKADDLKRIKGIGRKNEARLNELGIWNFGQIAAWTPENVVWVGSYLAFVGRIEREEWVAQAKILAAGGETEFSRRVDEGEVPTSRDEA